jgi:hypothetical protein
VLPPPPRGPRRGRPPPPTEPRSPHFGHKADRKKNRHGLRVVTGMTVTGYVMETQISDYKIERWIAVFLALLFLLPFVAQAQEPPKLEWKCAPAQVEGFQQCALMHEGKILTWRMALDHQVMQVRIIEQREGELRVAISRNGETWLPARFRVN